MITGRVQIKEMVRRGRETLFEPRPFMEFNVEGLTPAELRRAAQLKFNELYGPNRKVRSCVSPSKDAVVIIMITEIPAPFRPDGYVARAPAPTPSK